MCTAFGPLNTNRLSVCKASSPTLPCHTTASALCLSVASIFGSPLPSASTIWLSAPGTFSSAGRQFVPLAAGRGGERGNLSWVAGFGLWVRSSDIRRKIGGEPVFPLTLRARRQPALQSTLHSSPPKHLQFQSPWKLRGWLVRGDVDFLTPSVLWDANFIGT
ncbi:unnamed protein product [Pleuronectes platessa]|uniref:Uncharacterized protein n=1 Tax=Pleuronectes platessa TaxID=8262 RepID=A0A9N7U7X1_PLEPL|nr:unnamed protein product [Pleuronectes platessa]